jgi:hypothetical protein
MYSIKRYTYVAYMRSPDWAYKRMGPNLIVHHMIRNLQAPDPEPDQELASS